MVLKVKIKSRIVDKGANRITKELRRLNGLVADAGFFEPEQAAKASYAEFGTKTAPARPFMRPSFDKDVPRFVRSVSGNLGAVYDGKRDAKGVAENVARVEAGSLKKGLDSPGGPPLDEETTDEKGSSKKLVDTGAMRASLTTA